MKNKLNNQTSDTSDKQCATESRKQSHKSQVIILAGGKGTRMKGADQKVLSQLNGTTLLHHLISSVTSVCEKPTLIIGHNGESVIEGTNNSYHYVWQHEQLGTGHAVSCAREELQDKDHEHIIVVPGDCPLVSAKTLSDIVTSRALTQGAIAMATITVPRFEGEYEAFLHYGRIIRSLDGKVDGIVEYKDASEQERAITEVNAGIYCFDAKWLWEHIGLLDRKNQQGEYYLTDLVHIAVEDNKGVSAIPVDNFYEGLGVNTPEHLTMMKQYIS